MSGAGQWSDDRYTPEQKAYGDGEYDGYWGQQLRTGTFPNSVWDAYWRGYIAGTNERAQGPSDAQIDAWMKNIAAMDSDGNR